MLDEGRMDEGRMDEGDMDEGEMDESRVGHFRQHKADKIGGSLPFLFLGGGGGMRFLVLLSPESTKKSPGMPLTCVLRRQSGRHNQIHGENRPPPARPESKT